MKTFTTLGLALGLALVLLSGPVLMLLLGLGIIWAIKGFLSRRAVGSHAVLLCASLLVAIQTSH